MSLHTIAGVQRHTDFSPNHVGNDAAIFAAVTENLRAAGHTVNVYTELDYIAGRGNERYIYNMVRSHAALQRLQQQERSGAVAVNSGFGIENCTRERMTTILTDSGVPHPKSVVMNVTDEVPQSMKDGFEPCWVKRADFHAIHKEDVTYVRNLGELKEVMNEYALRGIGRVVINEHLAGDLIKFYGVNGTDFFYWFYPYNMKHSKFGLEKINGAPVGIHFSEDTLKEICSRAASALNVDVYGGDAIVNADGTMKIIDFNDWPSFAPCRDEAARAIAEVIIRKIENTQE